MSELEVLQQIVVHLETLEKIGCAAVCGLGFIAGGHFWRLVLFVKQERDF